MTAQLAGSLIVILGLLTALAVPLGHYVAQVLDGPSESRLGRWLAPVETRLYRLAGISPEQQMTWKQYAAALLVFNLLGMAAVYLLQRVQGMLPLNPAGHPGVPPALAFNTAVSFVTNTNWQAYAGESTLSHLTQMLGLTVQNFVSAAAGIAVMAVLVRALRRQGGGGLGNAWADLTRVTLYVLLPLALVVALGLVVQGVVQTFEGSSVAHLLEPSQRPDGSIVDQQTIALGPVASQVAIKQLGTNGGGFFNANSAHPFENPTPVSNLIELLSILLLPAALCFTFGRMVKDKRQGVAIYVAMLLLLVPATLLCVWAEREGTPALNALSDTTASALQSGGNMEGKEVRFGSADSAIWATFTTAASNGSVNAMHDSFTPLGGLIPLWLIQLGEVVFGGVGSGLYGMLMYAIVAVFLAGLMVGRTPEYLGKKIEAFEMKMAALVILIPAATVLVGTAVSAVHPVAAAAVGNPGVHGFSEMLYAFSSAANNNGSAFGGLSAGDTFYATALGLAMLIGRYWVMIPVLALAGRLAGKSPVPTSAGTLPTHGPMFVVLLVAVVLLVGALTFVPSLALGPSVEQLQLLSPSP